MWNYNIHFCHFRALYLVTTVGCGSQNELVNEAAQFPAPFAARLCLLLAPVSQWGRENGTACSLQLLSLLLLQYNCNYYYYTTAATSTTTTLLLQLLLHYYYYYTTTAAAATAISTATTAAAATTITKTTTTTYY